MLHTRIVSTVSNNNLTRRRMRVNQRKQLLKRAQMIPQLLMKVMKRRQPKAKTRKHRRPRLRMKKQLLSIKMMKHLPVAKTIKKQQPLKVTAKTRKRDRQKQRRPRRQPLQIRMRRQQQLKTRRSQPRLLRMKTAAHQQPMRRPQPQTSKKKPPLIAMTNPQALLLMRR